MSAPLIRRELAHRGGRYVWLGLAIAIAVTFTVGGFGFSTHMARLLLPAADLTAELEALPAGSVVIAAKTNSVTTATALDDRLLAQVRAQPGVALAEGSFDQPVAFRVPEDAQPERPAALRGVLLSSTYSQQRWEIISGRAPSGPDEIAVDQGGLAVAGLTAEDVGFTSTRLVLPTGTRSVTIVGLLGRPTGTAPAIAPPIDPRAVAFASAHVILDPDSAPLLLDAVGRVDRITVTPLPGQQPGELANRLRTALPSGVNVVAAESREAAEQHTVQQLSSQIQQLVTAFALLSAAISALVVVNTLGVVLAQRVREFSLLRILGASRGQVLWLVLRQSLLIGTGAILVGLPLGTFLGFWAAKFVGQGSADLNPNLTATMAIAGCAVGWGVSTIGALVPALRASRVDPIAGLSDSRAGAERTSRLSVPILALALAGAAGFAATELPPSPRWTSILLLVLAGGLFFVALASASRWIVQPFLAVVELALRRIGGISMRLGMRNAKRSPARTVGSASTLMVALLLVGIVGTLGASTRAAVVQEFKSSADVDLYLERRGVLRVSPTVVEEAFAAASGFVEFAGISSVDGQLLIAGSAVDQPTVTSFEDLSALADLDLTSGRLDSLEQSAPGQGSPLAISLKLATQLGVGVGDSATLVTVSGDTVPLRIVATYRNTALVGEAVLDRGTAILPAMVGTLELGLVRWSDTPQSRRFNDARIDREIRRFAREFGFLRVHTPERFGELNASVVDTVLNVLTIILVAMTAIGYLGLVATLGLATLERRRELVMLRAIGAGVGQVRHMVWGEAAAVGFLAASIGLTAGAGLGALAIRIGAIGSASEVVIPWRNNLFIGLGSICVAVAISMKVARRASLVPPAEAGR